MFLTIEKNFDLLYNMFMINIYKLNIVYTFIAAILPYIGGRRMKNLLLVTHGKFAEGILDSMSLIMGEVENTAFVSVTTSETIPVILQMLEQKIALFQNDAPTVILTDIPGGSTTQSAIKLLAAREDIYLIAGLNLGILLEIAVLDFTQDKEENKRRLRHIIESNKQNIYLVNDKMDEEIEDEL